MKKITVGMFSLAALVGMTAISAQTVRAEAGVPLEGAKQESGIEFGEGGGLEARGDSSVVSVSGDGVSRPALTAGKLDIEATRESVEVPAPNSSMRGAGEQTTKNKGVPKTFGDWVNMTIGGAIGAVAGAIVSGVLGFWPGAICGAIWGWPGFFSGMALIGGLVALVLVPRGIVEGVKDARDWPLF